ncbi:TetR/AcrR family transcriptional regulator [Actinokineospora terrae]|uniref:Transcriptional regulator, TetR family n=1 Tax=Actinokineospora terrae TaxID=155974 RepID=A0A1H9XGT2_9PSEU|nr:TetR/AcrR family transcriptional regulator [Actinokineospora terrae]SES45352.1 transcriptional regulator, TetR family [Actinokineospora terrae]
MDVRTAAADTGTKARTRRAILDAAVTVLTADPAASLADIAAAAGVGRTTVHRYFPERADLTTALQQMGWEHVVQATRRARLTEGTGAEGLDRLCQEYFELGNVLMLVFNYSAPDGDVTWECDPDNQSVLDLITRGHHDGSIDPTLTGPWIRDILWALLYAAWQQSRTGVASRHQALDSCLRALHKVVAP